jgi:predicted ArsR family transcriptional regulator
VPGPDLDRQLDSVATLADPVRRSLYRFVVSRVPQEVSRDEAAAAAGIQRSLAAFHLDRLVESGLLEPVYRRLSGRSGPGAGRPAKLYRRGREQVEISLPGRDYELLARLLVEALAGQPERTSIGGACSVARRTGKRWGEEAVGGSGDQPAAEAAAAVLDHHGFETAWDRAGNLRLRNCPFSALASEFTATVCNVNLCLQEGLLEGLEAGDLKAELSPQPGWCCVVLRRAAQPA